MAKSKMTIIPHCIVALILVGAIVGTLAGCFPTAKRKIELPSDVAVEQQVITDLEMVPGTVNYESDTVHIKASVDIPHPIPELTILSAERRNYNFEDIQNILPEDEGFEQSMVPDEATQVFLGSEGGMLTLQPGSIYYISGKSAKKPYSLILESALPMDDRYIDKGVFLQEEIEDLSRQKVVNQANSWLRELGVDNIGEAKVAALDIETLSKEYAKMTGDFPKESEMFEKDDEGYYLVFRCEYKGVPLLAQDYYLRDKAMCFGSVIKMIVTRNGLQQLSIQGIYDINETGKIQNGIYDFNQILNAVKARYQDIMLAEPVTISRIELIYAPDVVSVDPIVYELSPCWAVYASTDKSEKANIFFYYSALSGEEVENDSNS